MLSRLYARTLLTVFLLAGQVAWAAPSSTAANTVQREELIRRAFQGVGFIMSTAIGDKAFLSQATPDELRTMEKIYSVAQSANQREWLLKRHIPYQTNNGSEVFEYVLSDDVGRFQFETEFKSELIFSDDTNMFRLKPGQPDRTAVTSELDKRGDIYINRPLVNQSNFPLTFASAVGLAIHELGNKIGPRRDQAAIDKIAALFQKRVEQHTNTFQTALGTVSITAFEQLRFEAMMDHTLIPTRGSQKTLPLSFWPIGDQGLFAFLETRDKIHDFSEALMRSFPRATPTDFLRKSPYRWLGIQCFYGDSPRVQETAKGLRVEMNVGDHFALIPFMTPDSPRPPIGRPWAQSRDAFTYPVDKTARVTWDLDLDEKHALSVKAVDRKPELREDLNVKVEKVSSTQNQDEQVLTYKIPRVHKPLTNVAGYEIQPVLKLEHEKNYTEVWGKLRQGTTDHFEFIVPHPGQPGPVNVTGLEILPASFPYIGASNVRVYKFLLPDVESFIFPEPANPIPQVRELSLKSVQLWNGSQWQSLKRATSQIRVGSTLRFIFDSTTTLTSLAIEQSFMTKIASRVTAPTYPPMSGERKTFIQDRLVFIPPEMLTQTLIGNKLVVDWKIDHGIEMVGAGKRSLSPSEYMEYLRSAAPNAKTPPPPYGEVEYDYRVHGSERALGKIRATNASLQMLNSDLAKDVKIAIDHDLPKAMPLRKALTCKDLVK